MFISIVHTYIHYAFTRRSNIQQFSQCALNTQREEREEHQPNPSRGLFVAYLLFNQRDMEAGTTTPVFVPLVMCPRPHPSSFLLIPFALLSSFSLPLHPSPDPCSLSRPYHSIAEGSICHLSQPERLAVIQNPKNDISSLLELIIACNFEFWLDIGKLSFLMCNPSMPLSCCSQFIHFMHSLCQYPC